MTYLFDPEVLGEVVRAHLGLPVEQQFTGVAQALRSIYGEHVCPGQRWMWSTAGGVMTAVSPLHVSPNEYLLFSGTAIGSEGHSGRRRADLYDVIMSGELWTYEAGSFDRIVHNPGDVVALPRHVATGSRLRPGLWMLEYARGNLLSLFPYALADTLFSTLDFTDLRHQITTTGRLLGRELMVRWRERRSGQTFIPNLGALGGQAERGSKRGQKRNKGRSLAN